MNIPRTGQPGFMSREYIASDESPPHCSRALLGKWNGPPPSDLKANGFPAGSVELRNDVEPLTGILMQPSRHDGRPGRRRKYPSVNGHCSRDQPLAD